MVKGTRDKQIIEVTFLVKQKKNKNKSQGKEDEERKKSDGKSPVTGNLVTVCLVSMLLK